MVRLGRSYGDGPVPLNELADQEGLPLSYLEQIAGQLRRAGLITSRMGVKGGYALARRPELDLDARLAAVVGPVLVRLAQPETSFSSGKERLGDIGEVLLDSGERFVEPALDRLAQLVSELLELGEAPLQVLPLSG